MASGLAEGTRPIPHHWPGAKRPTANRLRLLPSSSAPCCSANPAALSPVRANIEAAGRAPPHRRSVRDTLILPVYLLRLRGVSQEKKSALVRHLPDMPPTTVVAPLCRAVLISSARRGRCREASRAEGLEGPSSERGGSERGKRGAASRRECFTAIPASAIMHPSACHTNSSA